MRNTEAAWVIQEYIRANSPCNGLLTALQMAVTALEHIPELRLGAVLCPSCGQISDYETWEQGPGGSWTCPRCSSSSYDNEIRQASQTFPLPPSQSIDLGSYSLNCDVCHTITSNKKALTCPRCGAHELKPVYQSDIGRQEATK
jgi:Zn finger protein HypA/HybF involved in hydrogenase expression